MNTSRTSLSIGIALLGALALIAGALVFHPGYSQASGTAGSMTGWAWSDTIGWIDLNCSNDNSCGTSSYGLTIGSDSTISGYAWSDNVGWVSANASDLTGCPTAPCSARMSGSAMAGWLKVLSSSDSQSGGWDGFISLSGSGYGPTLASNAFSGYSWGDVNVGWVNWDLARTTYSPCVSQNICSSNDVVDSCTGATVQSCTSGTICSAGACVVPPAPADSPSDGFTGHIVARPAIVQIGHTTRVFWHIDNVVDSTCSVTGTNGDSWTGSSYAGPSGRVSSAISSQTIYSLSCVGLDASTLRETATVNIIPVFQEQ